MSTRPFTTLKRYRTRFTATMAAVAVLSGGAVALTAGAASALPIERLRCLQDRGHSGRPVLWHVHHRRARGVRRGRLLGLQRLPEQLRVGREDKERKPGVLRGRSEDRLVPFTGACQATLVARRKSMYRRAGRRLSFSAPPR